jgi:cytochrome c-type biogenesis protein CcsB
MKKFKDILFSMYTTIGLLVVFGASIGYATFAENSDGTPYAKEIVYNAKWFEILLVLLIINLIGSIVRYKLIDKRKWSVLLFHIAFICILIGSAVTRYFGYEGMMHIRQGETSNEISSDRNSVQIIAEYNGQKVEKITEASFSETASTNFSESIEVGGKTITVQNELYLPNSIETIVPDDQGEPALSVFVMNEGNRGTEIILLNGESTELEGITYSFGDSVKKSDIQFTLNNDLLSLKSTLPMSQMGMMQKNQDMIQAGTPTPAQEKTIYKTEKMIFVLKSFIPKAKKELTQMTPDMNKTGVMMASKNAIIFNVSDGNASKRVNVLTSENQATQAATCKLNDVKVSISYGMLTHKLPFSITLRKFILDRYQGSMSPSSYASEITVTDKEKKTALPFRIFMNNILNYRGYRFFQSSYDNDEMGTVLSVNHDYWGTQVTYLGYLLMLIGMAMTLFSKKSRFSTLMSLTSQIQQKRKAGKVTLLIGLICLSGSVFAKEMVATKEIHLKLLNSLLVQDGAQGRIEPFNTYASDILRKIYKHDSYNDKSAVEVILGMSVNPEDWVKEAIIKVANPQLEKELGAVNGYVSYNQLFTKETYKLAESVEKTYQKEESARNKYEKELINVDERLNICTQIYSRNLLAFFPIPGNETGKWITAEMSTTTQPTANGQTCPFLEKEGKAGMSGMESGMMGGSTNADIAEASMPKDQANPHAGMDGMMADPAMGECTRDKSSTTTAMIAPTNLSSNTPEALLLSYFESVAMAFKSGDWAVPNEQLARIKNYQLTNGGNNLPSARRINLEISYNTWNIFLNLAICYGILGVILLILHFLYIFKPNVRLEKILGLAIYPLAFLFFVFTVGMAIRWYISGHAPWSNGYESMIFVGWGSSLAGLVFARKSPLAFSVTALLSAIALSVAAMSWMNPEITNLVPVLKSYWLIVHVAVITSSYGFLAMGALLGLLNLILMIGRTQKNRVHLTSNIEEINYIIEMALTVGLFMLTVGTFLGGVWANESWGRYWGWDAKETWALVSVLVYAAILHVRLLPKGNNPIILSTLALLGFSSVIMTFLGVNYYLSGMHSYGQGTPPPIPSAVYYVLVFIILLVVLAFNNERKYNKG